MSGGGGGGGITSDYFPDVCQPFYKSISLVSPNIEVLSKVKVKDELELSVFVVGDNKSLRVMRGNEVAGSIVKYAAQIIRCIEEGRSYKAIILSLDGAACDLEVVEIS